MSTEQQPIPTSSPASAPLPGPVIDDQAPPPGSRVAEPPVPGSEVPPAAGPGGEPQTPAADVPPAQPAPAQQLKIKRTRISGLWVAVGFFAVLLLLLLIFILQNGTTIQVSYMGAHGHLPLGVALLLSAVCGVLLVVLAGAARISQLRAVARRHRRADSQHAKAVKKTAR
ncbi:MAG: lipopolysaccharide assembly protein LapA domain-containing protein [Actinomycetota bacterium]|nr:lipopolysaccharide assembly protein LapA domain-containing protein [Actinomycetota bacterium]